MLILMAGLPGTGKTTAAERLAPEIKARVLSTDIIRRRNTERPRYTPRRKEQVYEKMLEEAEELLREDVDVVLDATFYRKEFRRRAFLLGKRTGRRVLLVEVVCPEGVVRRRMEQRARERQGFSEADLRIYELIRKSFDPIERSHFTLDTGDPEALEERLADLANKIRVMATLSRIINPLKKSAGMRLLQTHISWVLLDGRHAYKVKKPVRFSFVDYRSLSRRKHFCLEEVRVNSRLSPGIYQGVVPIRRQNGSISLGGRGRTQDYAVKMVEFPQEDRMDNLLKKGRVERRQVEAIARILADFHSRVDEAPRGYGSLRTIKDNFRPAFDARPIVEKLLRGGSRLAAVESKVLAFMRIQGSVFKKRASEGRIRDCHGDVRTKNIFLHEGEVFIFDAIEFNPALSRCDVAAEVAFLAMDLSYFGEGGLADAFEREYIHCSGDSGIRPLIDFYRCYRALVQMLVEAYTAVDPETGKRRKAAAKTACRRYLDLAAALADKLDSAHPERPERSEGHGQPGKR